VQTYSFSLPNQQDETFGRQFAERIDTIHTHIPINLKITDIEKSLSMRMSAALKEYMNQSALHIPNPGLIWSGDGGSVGVGHVYMSHNIVKLLRAGKRAEAVQLFIDQQNAHITKRLFKTRIAAVLSKLLAVSINEELNDIYCHDPARGFHIFLLLNDQRRHLANHFENIDIHRIEFHLPFFESDFLKSILSGPIDLYLCHKFYNKWLTLFPAAVTSVPWQSYPGHEPCPLPIPEGLRYQWQPDHFKDLYKIQKLELLRSANKLFKEKDFPHDIMSKKRLRLAMWIYHTGARDYGHVIKTAGTIYKYWTICDGNYTLQGLG